MKSKILAALGAAGLLLLAACSAITGLGSTTTTVSAQAISDAQLVDSGLVTLEGVIALLPSGPSVTGALAAVTAADAAVKGYINAAKSGSITPASMASSILASTASVKTQVLSELNANASITAGVNALWSVASNLLSEAGASPPATTVAPSSTGTTATAAIAARQTVTPDAARLALGAFIRDNAKSAR